MTTPAAPLATLPPPPPPSTPTNAQPQQPASAPNDTMSLMQQVLAQQSNTQGLTQVGPQIPQVQQQPRPTTAQGVDESLRQLGRANLPGAVMGVVRTAINKFEERKQRELFKTVDSFTQSVKGIQDSQAQMTTAKNQVGQAFQAYKQNPTPENQQALKAATDSYNSASQALKTNQTNLNDIFAGSKGEKNHKILAKAFGIDDKNADTPERKAAIQSLQQSMGVGGKAGDILSKLPQTQQLSPQATGQQMARQAGVVGTPGQQMKAAETAVAEAGKDTRASQSEQGKDYRAGLKDQITATMNGQKYNDSGKLVPMTPQEISANPVLDAKMKASDAATQLKQAQTQLADMKGKAMPEELKMQEAKVSALQGNLMMRQKEFGVKVHEEERKQLETDIKVGSAGTVTGTDGVTRDISGLTGGRPMQPWAQKTIAEAQPVIDQVDDLIAKLEPLKDNNQAGYLALDRLGYAMGIASENGSLASQISNIEIQKVVSAASLLKGSSRSLSALELAMVHTPDAWKDSPQLMYQKLTTIRDRLNGVVKDTVTYGAKNARQGDMPKSPKAQDDLDKKILDGLDKLGK